MGESGCGKSTLLDILALVLRPSSVGSFVLRDGGTHRSVDANALWQANDEDALARVPAARFGVLQASLRFLTTQSTKLDFLSFSGSMTFIRVTPFAR